MSELIATINKKSQNLHTEMLLRLLGARRGGVGTQESGAEAVEEFLHRMGVRTGDVAAPGRLRPVALRSPLAARDGHAAGGHGPPSPRRRLPGQPARGRGGRHAGLADEGHGGGGRVQAKTGTIRNVNALAGYVDRAQRRAPGLLRGGQPPHRRRLGGDGRPRRPGRAARRARERARSRSRWRADLAGRVRLGRGGHRGRRRARVRPRPGRGDRGRRRRISAGVTPAWRAATSRGGGRARPLQGGRARSHQDAALERGAAAPRAEGRGAVHGEHAGGRAQPLVGARADAVRPVRPRPRGAAGRAAARARPASPTKASARPRSTWTGARCCPTPAGPLATRPRIPRAR